MTFKLKTTNFNKNYLFNLGANETTALASQEPTEVEVELTGFKPLERYIKTFEVMSELPIARGMYLAEIDGREMVRYWSHQYMVRPDNFMLYQGDSVPALLNHNRMPNDMLTARFVNFRAENNKLFADLDMVLADKGGKPFEHARIISSMIDAGLKVSASLTTDWSVEDDTISLNLVDNNSELNPDILTISKFMIMECSIVTIPAVASATNK